MRELVYAGVVISAVIGTKVSIMPECLEQAKTKTFPISAGRYTVVFQKPPLSSSEQVGASVPAYAVTVLLAVENGANISDKHRGQATHRKRTTS